MLAYVVSGSIGNEKALDKTIDKIMINDMMTANGAAKCASFSGIYLLSYPSTVIVARAVASVCSAVMLSSCRQLQSACESVLSRVNRSPYNGVSDALISN
jgi:hypothetical protein